MKPFWITIIVGVLGLVATFFLTRSGVVKEYEGKFDKWCADFKANYRVEPEKVKIPLSKEDSIAIAESRPVYRWLAAKPRALTPEEELIVAQRLFGLTLAEKDSMLAALSIERQSEPETVTDSIQNEHGELITVTQTHFLSYSPLSQNPFGRFSYISEVTYPRSGTTFVPPEEEGEPFVEGLFAKVGINSQIGEWKTLGGTGTVMLPFNIGSGRQIIPQLEYETLGKRGLAKIELSQKLF